MQDNCEFQSNAAHYVLATLGPGLLLWIVIDQTCSNCLTTLCQGLSFLTMTMAAVAWLEPYT